MVSIAINKSTKSSPSTTKTINMILNVSAKSLALLLVIGVASTTGSNLRQRRATLFNHGQEADAAAASTVSKQSGSNSNSNLRSPSVSTPSASEDVTAEEEEPASVATSVATEPSIELDQTTYLEDDAISVTFSVGSPTHPYYSSSEAPSRSLDHDYPTWSIGLFMRDADPQGGTLSPIVSINVCGAMGSDCDVNDRSFASYGDRTVTFGSEYLDVMQGRWPLEVSHYGTGFDAYVLDGNGAAAIGPLEFYIQSELDEDVDTTHAHGSGATSYRPKSSSSSSSMVESSSSIKSNTSTNPLLKYGKGTKKVSERQHASVSAAAKKANAKLGSANGLEMSGNAIPSDPSIHKVASTTEESSTPGGQCCQGSITTPKDEYEYDDNVSIDFSIDSNLEVLANYKIGIFMRMAHPQGGALEPVVSLPLCGSTTTSNTCITTDDLTYSGSVTFSQESMTSMIGAPEWPIDLYQWGTGFDAYILNENGADVVGPVKFNIMMDDTY